MKNNAYVASNGDVLDISSINTERLINSLAKHHRDIYASENKEQFTFHSEQIAIIDAELLIRNAEFLNKKMEGNVWK